MTKTIDLSGMDSNSFQQMVNMLSLRILGAGATGFGPGPDAGRDGYFEGVAPYPNENESWKGVWYLQSKFHEPHLTADPQKWLVKEIKKEIKAFSSEDTKRVWPNIWIIATNIDLSGSAQNGSFDVINQLVKDANPELAKKTHVWGGRKLLDFLGMHKDVLDYYREFITPGHVLSEILDSISSDRASAKDILNHLIVEQFENQKYTKLDQAGSDADSRPGVHKLFVDLPFKHESIDGDALILEKLLLSSANCHRISNTYKGEEWSSWNNHPNRSRVYFLLGGPGNGKSTTVQYFSQLQRAAFIKNWWETPVHAKYIEQSEDIRSLAVSKGHWPKSPRIPINIELKEYAQWFGHQGESSRGILSFLAFELSRAIESKVTSSLVKKAISNKRWFIAFDGLDEVPSDVKNELSEEVVRFIDITCVTCDSDTMFVCTSRPQGYSGQFSGKWCR